MPTVPDYLSPPQVVEYDVAVKTILCDCGCHPQAVHDCACGRAEEMRSEIAARIAQGKTGQQVIDAYVAHHGEKILVAPTAQGFNLVAWLGPGALLVGAAVGLTLVLKRWRRPTSEAPHRESPLEESWERRLEDAMREYDK